MGKSGGAKARARKTRKVRREKFRNEVAAFFKDPSLGQAALLRLEGQLDAFRAASKALRQSTPLIDALKDPVFQKALRAEVLARAGKFGKSLNSAELEFIRQLSSRRSVFDLPATSRDISNRIFGKLADLAEEAGFVFPSHFNGPEGIQGFKIDVMQAAFIKFSSKAAPSRDYYLGRRSRMAGHLFEEFVIRSEYLLQLTNKRAGVLKALNSLPMSKLRTITDIPPALRAMSPNFTRIELLTEVVDGHGKQITDFMIVAVADGVGGKPGAHWILAIGECKLESVASRLFGKDGQFLKVKERLLERGFKYKSSRALGTPSVTSTAVSKVGEVRVPPDQMILGRSKDLPEAARTELFGAIFKDNAIGNVESARAGMKIKQLTKGELGMGGDMQDLAGVMLHGLGIAQK